MQSKTQRQIKGIPVVPSANILSCAKVVRYQIVKCVYFQTFLQISWGIVWGIVYFKFYPRCFNFSTFDCHYFELITIFKGKYEHSEPQKCPHNPEVVGSSPASATITDTVMDTNVSVTVSFFMLIFTPKQGDYPNFATYFLQVLPSCCGFVVCPGCPIPTCCAFNSLNNCYSLYSR